MPESQYPFEVLAPCDLQKSDLVVLGESSDNPETQQWHTLIKCHDQLISINLKKEYSFGYCYDSFWDIYGTINNDTLIARSFSELLLKIIKSEGKNLFWIDNHC